jgi:chromatin modification-related protein VID21
MNQVNSPFDLVEAKWQRDMKDARDRQARQQQMQEARALALRQQQQAAMLNAQQAQQGGQVMRPPGQLAQPGQPGQPGAPGAGQPRMGPNGQPIPNMAPSQQQLLTAVAAANAARQQGQVPNAGGNVPRPQNGGAGTPGVPQGAQNPQVQQQMQMLQAQQLAARQAQAQAQQGQTGVRVPSGGTPHAQPRNLSGSPYSHAQGELPVGQGQGDHGSPVVNTNMQVGQQSSPNQQGGVGRVASGPMNQGQIPQHLRVPSGGNGSPQMNNAMPQGGQMQQPQINQALMQSMINTLQANGQQATPETIRALHLTMMRNVSRAGV